MFGERPLKVLHFSGTEGGGGACFVDMPVVATVYI